MTTCRPPIVQFGVRTLDTQNWYHCGSPIARISMDRFLLSSCLLLVCVACSDGGGDPTPTPIPTPIPELALQPVATGLDFPLFLTTPPGDARLFVVERYG